MEKPKQRIGVVGAGAMGSGIAQVAASAGLPVVVADATLGAVERARGAMALSLDKLVTKGKMLDVDRDHTLANITWVESPLDDEMDVYRECDVVIEAVVEDLQVKQRLFSRLEHVVAPHAVLATNTSSLSVASIASDCKLPSRVLGVHFFNPAPVMPLVEIVPWLGSDMEVVRQTQALVDSWKKTTVVASDTPGFIVNRVARPFYGEALRLYDEGLADHVTIDWAMRELGKFRMGPFELMDFIGNDVNYAVTRSVFEAFSFDPRYRPSLTQRRLVEAGFLGRKSGRGYYDYRDPSGAVPEPRRDTALAQQIVDRMLAMLVNEAVDAVFWRVASPRDIDLAMTKGVNYPKGLLAWGEEIGLEKVLSRLEGLQAEYGEDRYRPSPLLRRMVRDKARFFT